MASGMCRVCGSKKLLKVLDLGSMPSANILVLKEDLARVKSHPLQCYWCEECSFFQQVDLVDRDELFGDFYKYQTGVNPPAVEHFRELAIKLGKAGPNKKLAVVVASNDGTEIALLKEFGGFSRVIGVEPSKNMADLANVHGLETINAFFGQKQGKKMASEYGNADLVIANNVFAHIPEPKDFLLGMKELVKEDGLIVIEVHWLRDFVQQLQIDTVYAEHYFVWSVKALNKIAELCGLSVAGVEYLPERLGGSIRASFSKSKKGDIKWFIDEEKKAGLYDKATMTELQKRANKRKADIVALIRKLKGQGKRIAVWTAPAKICTLLNFCGLTDRELECAYEITDGKIGKYIPGANLLIKDEKSIERDMPDYLLVGAWNYIGFMKKKLKWYTDRGGKLINPLTCEIL
jgi:SAM-dependent methyltransferase